MLGAIESLLSAVVADGMIGGHDYNQKVEIVVQEIFGKDLKGPVKVFNEGAKSWLVKLSDVKEYYPE